MNKYLEPEEIKEKSKRRNQRNQIKQSRVYIVKMFIGQLITTRIIYVSIRVIKTNIFIFPQYFERAKAFETHLTVEAQKF